MTETNANSWRTSSFSVNATACVEVADAGNGVFVRDSKQPDQGHLTFTRAELAAFISGCKAGEFDDLA